MAKRKTLTRENRNGDCIGVQSITCISSGQIKTAAKTADLPRRNYEDRGFDA